MRTWPPTAATAKASPSDGVAAGVDTAAGGANATSRSRLTIPPVSAGRSPTPRAEDVTGSPVRAASTSRRPSPSTYAWKAETTTWSPASPRTSGTSRTSARSRRSVLGSPVTTGGGAGQPCSWCSADCRSARRSTVSGVAGTAVSRIRQAIEGSPPQAGGLLSVTAATSAPPIAAGARPGSAAPGPASCARSRRAGPRRPRSSGSRRPTGGRPRNARGLRSMTFAYAVTPRTYAGWLLYSNRAFATPRGPRAKPLEAR